MDVNTHKALGLIGYTTLDSNVYSGKYKNDYSLSEWLELLLIDHKQFEKMTWSREIVRDLIIN